MQKQIQLKFEDIKKAEARLKPYIKKTNLTQSMPLSHKIATNVFFKWETEQPIKSFKIRGALNKILCLSAEEKSKGLIAASAGNHAQGLAFAAQLLNIKARVVMMTTASKIKISSTKNLGAELILKGKTYDESYQHALSIKGDSVFIHPFADAKIIAGQATVGLEVIKTLPELDSVVVPIGGGGLLTGLSLAIKTLKPSVRVYGVTWEGTADFCRNYNKISVKDHCLCQKKIPLQNSKSGLTDGIAVKKSSLEIIKLCSQYVDAIACVSEKEISQAIGYFKQTENKTVEGSGAAALAGLLKYNKKWDLGKNCCVIVSGANIDTELLSQLMQSPQKTVKQLKSC